MYNNYYNIPFLKKNKIFFSRFHKKWENSGKSLILKIIRPLNIVVDNVHYQKKC